MTDAVDVPEFPHFYQLDLPERQLLAREAASAGKTLLFRWTHLAREATDSWQARAQRAATMVGAVGSVVDLGCGTMALERYLVPGTRYIPVDVVARDERTLVLDLNHQRLPPLGADMLVGLGILEYVYDLPRLLSGIAGAVGHALLSYNSLDRFPDTEQRVGHAWVNHLQRDELESLFAEAGLDIVERQDVDGTQTLWRLRSRLRADLAPARPIVLTGDLLRTH